MNKNVVLVGLFPLFPLMIRGRSHLFPALFPPQVAAQCSIELPRIDGSQYISLLDECGGHTHEYHFHENMSCLYAKSSGQHSPAIGAEAARAVPDSQQFMLYGKYENFKFSDAELPLLDACGGHFGVTPDSNGDKVYHYHVQDKAPFTFGCFGPDVDSDGNAALVSLAKCRSLYSGCGDGDVSTITRHQGAVGKGLGAIQVEYDFWCPCYDADGSNVGNKELPAVVKAGGAPLPALPISSGDTFVSIQTATAVAQPAPKSADGGAKKWTGAKNWQPSEGDWMNMGKGGETESKAAWSSSSSSSTSGSAGAKPPVAQWGKEDWTGEKPPKEEWGAWMNNEQGEGDKTGKDVQNWNKMSKDDAMSKDAMLGKDAMPSKDAMPAKASNFLSARPPQRKARKPRNPRFKKRIQAVIEMKMDVPKNVTADALLQDPGFTSAAQKSLATALNVEEERIEVTGFEFVVMENIDGLFLRARRKLQSATEGGARGAKTRTTRTHYNVLAETEEEVFTLTTKLSAPETMEKFAEETQKQIAQAKFETPALVSNPLVVQNALPAVKSAVITAVTTPAPGISAFLPSLQPETGTLPTAAALLTKPTLPSVVAGIQASAGVQQINHAGSTVLGAGVQAQPTPNTSLVASSTLPASGADAAGERARIDGGVGNEAVGVLGDDRPPHDVEEPETSVGAGTTSSSGVLGAGAASPAAGTVSSPAVSDHVPVLLAIVGALAVLAVLCRPSMILRMHKKSTSANSGSSAKADLASNPRHYVKKIGPAEVGDDDVSTTASTRSTSSSKEKNIPHAFVARWRDERVRDVPAQVVPARQSRRSAGAEPGGARRAASVDRRPPPAGWEDRLAKVQDRERVRAERKKKLAGSSVSASGSGEERMQKALRKKSAGNGGRSSSAGAGRNRSDGGGSNKGGQRRSGGADTMR